MARVDPEWAEDMWDHAYGFDDFFDCDNPDVVARVLPETPRVPFDRFYESKSAETVEY